MRTKNNSLNFKEAISFDDLLMVPKYSKIVPNEVDTSVNLSDKIRLKIPLISAAMDTVTESQMAIELAREGGLGVIHRNMPPEQQAQEIKTVKRAESTLIKEPITVRPEQPIKEVLAIMKKHKISGLPVTRGEKLVGILTNRDLRFETDLDKTVQDLMTSELITAQKGVDFEQAKKVLHDNRIEKLLVIDKDNHLYGLMTVKDIQKQTEHPNALKDEEGHLIVAGALGVGSDLEERATLLAEAGADIFAIDTAHGHSENVKRTIRFLKDKFPEKLLVGGNVATAEGTKFLIDAGADIIKIGVGPGSICTTRVISGFGIPQASAILEGVRVAKDAHIPIIADGGIKYSGDIAKAIGLGASAVMIGNLFAGTEEAPGETILFEGRTYKQYRGMGSLEALKKGARDRYHQEHVAPEKLVPEGIEGRIPYKGPVKESILQLVGGLKAGMGMCGAENILELQRKAEFIKISPAGLEESHPHNVTLAKEAPNYRIK